MTADNELWRQLCLPALPSDFAASRPLTTPSPIPNREVLDLQRVVQNPLSSHHANPDPSDVIHLGSAKLETFGSKASVVNWDPAAPGERIDWSSEYVARHAPISLDWLPQPHDKNALLERRLEVQGLALLDDTTALGPVEDGSICFWGIESSEEEYTRILNRSQAGLLLRGGGKGPPNPGTVECVSVDKMRNKAYFAIDSSLKEVDLAALQVTAHQEYSQPISVISEATHPTPLTVGTSHSLHLYDPRDGAKGRRCSIDLQVHTREQNDFHRILEGDSRHAILTESVPLSVVHATAHDIHVAGRFPGILFYDRRFFPQMSHSIYSGARLSCIAPFPSTHGVSLAAVGEYKGKGSLEVYPLDVSSRLRDLGTVKNRTSASRCKVLSVMSHGARLLTTDGDGLLKWTERDGSTLVRRWNVNSYTSNSERTLRPNIPTTGIFNSQVNEGEVVRKMVARNARANCDTCLWTGERLGVLHFGHARELHEQAQNTGIEADALRDSSDFAGRESRDYELYMRQALERQANEVRFMQGLGLSG